MVAQLQEAWKKVNPRERLSAIGAGLVILAWIVSLASYGVGAGTIALIGAIAVLAILYLKYAPNQNITWPAPVSLLIFGISAVVALLVAVDVLGSIRWIGLFGGAAVIALLLEAAGAALMIWGAWQEYQIEKPAIPNFSGTNTTTPAAPPAAPVQTAPPAQTVPPAAPVASVDDRDEAPPA
jgi:hypothetical protein